MKFLLRVQKRSFTQGIDMKLTFLLPDLVSLKQEEEPEKEEQVEQVEQAEATGVATAANNAVLIAICVLLALLSSALSLYICWTKHRGEKTCQKQQLESMLSSFPVFFRTIIPLLID